MRRSIGLAASLVAGALALWLGSQGGEESEASRFGSAAGARASFDWRVGRVYRYDLSFRSDHTTRPAQQTGSGRALLAPMSAAFDVEGVLALRVHEQLGDGWVVGLSVEGCRSANLELGEDTVLEGEAACEAISSGGEVLMQMDRQGRFEGVYEDDAGTAGFSAFVGRVLASELSVTLGAGDSWSAEETTLSGVAVSNYRWEPDAVGRHPTFARSRSEYRELRVLRTTEPEGIDARVDAEHRFELHPDGYLAGVAGREHLRVDAPEGTLLDGVSELRMRLASIGAFHGGSAVVAGSRLVDLAAPPADAERARRRLELRAEGLTPEEALSMMAEFGPSGVLPEHARSLVRIHALLQLDDQLAEAIGSLATREDASAELKGLSLDLLAQAGTHAAQSALRTVLGAAEGDPNRVHYMQRAALIASPEPETLAMLEAIAGSSGDERIAAHYTLASAARNLRAAGEHEQSARILEPLRREARLAANPEQRTHSLLALANGEDLDSLGLFETGLRDESPAVRRAALVGLARLDDERAHQAIVSAISDETSSVQSAALHRLAQVGARSEDLDILARHAEEGRIRPDNVAAMIHVLASAQRDAPDVTRRIAAALLSTAGVQDVQLRAALQRLAHG